MLSGATENTSRGNMNKASLTTLGFLNGPEQLWGQPDLQSDIRLAEPIIILIIVITIIIIDKYVCSPPFNIIISYCFIHQQ